MTNVYMAKISLGVRSGFKRGKKALSGVAQMVPDQLPALLPGSKRGQGGFFFFAKSVLGPQPS